MTCRSCNRELRPEITSGDPYRCLFCVNDGRVIARRAKGAAMEADRAKRVPEINRRRASDAASKRVKLSADDFFALSDQIRDIHRKLFGL